MKLIVRIILLCIAALMLAAAQDDGVLPAAPSASPLDSQWQSNVIPPTGSWPAVFSSSWR